MISIGTSLIITVAFSALAYVLGAVAQNEVCRSKEEKEHEASN